MIEPFGDAFPIAAVACSRTCQLYAVGVYSAVQFVELSTFTKRLVGRLDDESYGDLQVTLMDRPDLGALIPRGGGLRKVRWAPTGRGKRGGMRVIYYWHTADDEIIFFDIYAKNEKENLEGKELANLRKKLDS